MAFILVASPSGTGLREFSQQILTSITKSGRSATWVDLEDELIKLQATEEAIDAFNKLRGSEKTVPIEGQGMATVTALPRQQVLELWRSAAFEVGKRIKSATRTGDLALLAVNLTYFNIERREFYFPFQMKSLFEHAGQVPDKVVLLFDDIYDTFARLTAQPGSKDVPVFDRKRRITELALRRIQDGLDFASPQKRGDLAIEWIVHTLLLILQWRRHETLYAENIAADIRRPFLPFAVKQDVRELACWITDQQSGSVYISHPISEFRNQQFESKSNDWDRGVHLLNSTPDALAKHHLVALMPTAIDEYRIRSDTLGLKARWPLRNNILYRQPEDGPEHSSLFLPTVPPKDDPDTWLDEKNPWVQFPNEFDQLRARTFLEILSMQIEEQMALRDHLLVAHCDHMCIYRPYFRKGKLSRGVLSEVGHWEAKATRNGVTRAAFVHATEDLRLVGQTEVFRNWLTIMRRSVSARGTHALSGGRPAEQISEEAWVEEIQSKLQPEIQSAAAVSAWVQNEGELSTESPLPIDTLKWLASRYVETGKKAWLSQVKDIIELLTSTMDDDVTPGQSPVAEPTR